MFIGYVDVLQNFVRVIYFRHLLQRWFPQTIFKLLCEYDYCQTMNFSARSIEIFNILITISNLIIAEDVKIRTAINFELKDLNSILSCFNKISSEYQLKLNDHPAPATWSIIPSKCSVDGPLKIKIGNSNTYKLRLAQRLDGKSVHYEESEFTVYLNQMNQLIPTHPPPSNHNVRIETFQDDNRYVNLSVKVCGVQIQGCPLQISIEIDSDSKVKRNNGLLNFVFGR